MTGPVFSSRLCERKKKKNQINLYLAQLQEENQEQSYKRKTKSKYQLDQNLTQTWISKKKGKNNTLVFLTLEGNWFQIGSMRLKKGGPKGFSFAHGMPNASQISG